MHIKVQFISCSLHTQTVGCDEIQGNPNHLYVSGLSAVLQRDVNFGNIEILSLMLYFAAVIILMYDKL